MNTYTGLSPRTTAYVAVEHVQGRDAGVQGCQRPDHHGVAPQSLHRA